MAQKKIRIGISTGDLNGIGLEVILKTFLDNRMFDLCTPVLYANKTWVESYKKEGNISGNISLFEVKEGQPFSQGKMNIVSSWKDNITPQLGSLNKQHAKFALQSLEKATNDLSENKIDALVTAPIHKDLMQQKDFSFPGHTEFLSEKFSSPNLMLMCNGKLKVGLVTNHVPIIEVSRHITTQLVYDKIKILHRSLVQDFQIPAPKIAILGLNPHAGDNGLIGKEESEKIVPAITRANTEKMFAFGPYSADGFFGSGTFNKFDAVLAMYHDQGLTPFKTLSFGNGVNYSAGLSIIRTSPDHGTAFDIAGKNQANFESFREAIRQASDIFHCRANHKEISANPLPISSNKQKVLR